MPGYTSYREYAAYMPGYMRLQCADKFPDLGIWDIQ